MIKKKQILYLATANDGLETFVYREVNILTTQVPEVTLALFKNKNIADSNSPKKSWNTISVNLQTFLLGLFLAMVLNPKQTLKMFVFCFKNRAFREMFASFSIWFQIRHLEFGVIYSCFADRKMFVGYLLNHYFMNDRAQLITSVHAHEIYASPNIGLFNQIILKMNKIISISEKNKNILSKKFGVPAEKIIVNRLTIDTHLFNPAPMPCIVTVCRFEERKGLLDLLEASASFVGEANFVIVGWGELDIAKIVEEQNLVNVTVFGKMSQKQVRLILERSDIFCLPSKHTQEGGSEGIPVALMEAMASGLHIVSTRNGSIQELVNTILVEENDVSSLTTGLFQAIDEFKNNKRNLQNVERVLQLHGRNNEQKIIKILKGISHD